MAVNAKAIIQTQYAPNTETTMYTSPAGTRTIIDKMTATNSLGAGPYVLTIRLVTAGGTAGVANLIVTKTLAVGEVYTFPEIVGHLLEAGDFISMLCNTASAVVVRSAGRQVT